MTPTGEGGEQGSDHVGQTPDLDEGIYFRRDEQDLELGHGATGYAGVMPIAKPAASLVKLG